MRIGIDFDNTIAGYDHVFRDVAREWNLLDDNFTGDKRAVRDTLRQNEHGEFQWQQLQGRIYGKYMYRAQLIEGVTPFIRHAQRVGAELFIVSHKTRYGHHDAERIDLREAALQWMEKQGFFHNEGLNLTPGSIFFEETRDAKISRITSLNFDCFIDDLPEIFSHPGFPPCVESYLYAPSCIENVPKGVHLCRSWIEIERAVFGGYA